MLRRRDFISRLIGLTAWAQARSSADGDDLPALMKRQVSVPLVDKEGRVLSRHPAWTVYFVEELGEGSRLEMAVIPGGDFAMGSASANEPSRLSEQPVHRVRIRPFALGVFPITRDQWRRVSNFPEVAVPLRRVLPGNATPEVEGLLPVDIVSWPEAVEFCERLRRHTKREYRLPSEAEWEYACRAGTVTKYHFGDGISLDVANYNNGITRPLSLTPVGSKQAPNRFGLHDMHGNVLEWNADRVHDSYVGAPSDGTAWTSGGSSESRVCRGGMYLWNADVARSASRIGSDVRGTFSGLGLRIALGTSIGIQDPIITSISNAASGLRAAVAPGEIIAVRGANLGPNLPVSLAFDESGFVSTKLGGVRLLFDDVPAPLLYVSSEQVNAVVPYEVATLTNTQVTIEIQGQSSPTVSASIAVADPGLFTADCSGAGQCVAVNENGVLNSSENPAPRGSIVTVYATGEGQTTPPGVTGKLAGESLSKPSLAVRLLIADTSVEIYRVGSVMNQIAGLAQVVVRVPTEILPGRQEVILRVGEARSQPDVFLYVI